MSKELSIIERVKTFKDACKILGLDPENLPIVEGLPEKDRRSIIAYYKLIVISRALNDRWEPCFSDWNKYKYWNEVCIDDGVYKGFACCYSNGADSTTSTSVGSRLCFKTRELATYACENFRDLYFEYLFIDIPKNYRK